MTRYIHLTWAAIAALLLHQLPLHAQTDGKSYYIMARHSGKVLDVAGASKNVGAVIMQHAQHGGPNQQFTFRRRSKGWVIYPKTASELIIGVEGEKVDNGTRIVQCASGYMNFSGRCGTWIDQLQFFNVTPTSDGYVKIEVADGKGGGRVLDVSGAAMNDGAPIAQWGFTGGENQQFKLVLVEGGGGEASTGDAGSEIKAGEEPWYGPNGEQLFLTRSSIAPPTISIRQQFTHEYKKDATQTSEVRLNYTRADGASTVTLGPNSLVLDKITWSRTLEAAKAAQTQGPDIFSAIQANNIQTIRELVEEGTDLNTTLNANGQTALIHAISTGKMDMAKSLIAMGASPTVAGTDGKTPMDLAAGKGDAELVGALIDGGAQVNTTHIDAAMGRPAVVRMMVSKSNNPANASHAVNAALAKGNTELFKSLAETHGVALTNAHYESAVSAGRIEIALYVLEAPGIDYNAALGASLAKANKPLIERCLDKGAAPAPALGWAVDRGDIPFATMCITQYGADVNGALPQAAAKGSAPMVNMLLDNGAEASRGLQSAVASGSLPMATLLLDRGADATAATACLQTAVDNGSLPMATLLIERGADANGQMANASGRGNDAMVKLLIAKGGDPNAGMAAAVRSDKASTVEVLVNSGADPAPAVGYAVGKGNAPLLDLLISKGADVTKPDLVKTAVRRKDTATLLVLLEKGRASADPGMALAVDSLGEDIVGILLNHNADATPDRYIKKAVERKSIPIATLLLAKGADANNGVLLAIQKNHLEMVTLLKNNNGDLSRTGYLAASVGFDNVPLSTLIVDAGCPVQEGVDPAVTAGAGKVMGLLVDKGADVKNVDLIVRAVNGSFPGVVEALLRGGCDPKEYIDPATGGNLMHVAATRNDFQTVQLLHRAGVNMHYKAAGSGDTPLHAAVRGRDNNDMVVFMVETGQADVNAVNAKGKSVYQEAPAGSGIPKYLKGKGAERKPEK